jgi:hypothetical protein
MPIETPPHAITRQTFGSRLMGRRVPAVMSGSTSSGRGPNCETDVIGHERTFNTCPEPALARLVRA